MLEIFEYQFFQNAILASILTALACGVIGSFIVVKKISFISGSIAHASFGGIGLAYFLGINPMVGAIIFSIFSALGIGVVNKTSKQQEDASIGAMWAVGMAIGLIFIHLTPGYATDLFSYLFGNLLFVSSQEITFMVILNLFIISSVFLWFNKLMAFIFDEEFARAINLNTFLLYLFLLILIALSVVLLIRSVGVILVIALLTLPAATAQLLTKRFKNLILISIALALFFNLVGLFLSYYFNFPSGPIIILTAAFIYILIFVSRKIIMKQL